MHSVDYYNHCEYPNEDEMPNRCGIMHVRGPQPTAKISSTELSEYCRNFESKMSAFLAPVATVNSDEFESLGAKNAEAYPFFIVLINLFSRIDVFHRTRKENSNFMMFSLTLTKLQ